MRLYWETAPSPPKYSRLSRTHRDKRKAEELVSDFCHARNSTQTLGKHQSNSTHRLTAGYSPGRGISVGRHVWPFYMETLAFNIGKQEEEREGGQTESQLLERSCGLTSRRPACSLLSFPIEANFVCGKHSILDKLDSAALMYRGSSELDQAPPIELERVKMRKHSSYL